MTNREAIRQTIQIPGVTDFDKVAIDLGIDLEADYAAGNKDLVDTASLSVLLNLRGLKSISEGDFTIQLDSDAIEARISFLTTGNATPVPTIRSGSGLW